MRFDVPRVHFVGVYLGAAVGLFRSYAVFNGA